LWEDPLQLTIALVTGTLGIPLHVKASVQHLKARIRLVFHFTKPGEWKDLHISFLGEPDLPIEITAVGAFDITQIPGLNGIIQGAIVGALQRKFAPPGTVAHC